VDFYRTPRGKPLTRRMAYRDIGFVGYYRDPVYALLYSAVRLGAFDGGPTPREDDLVWQGVRDLVRQFLERKLEGPDMGEILKMWLPIGWQKPRGLWPAFRDRSKLDPAMKQALALIVGYRCRKTGYHEDAAAFLREAAEMAPASDHGKLARERLTEWYPKAP
jgi:hypothetical protein